MKQKRHTTEEIIRILREADGGKDPEAVCRKHNVSAASFYRCKKKFGGMELKDARKYRQLEKENSELKQMTHPHKQLTILSTQTSHTFWTKVGASITTFVVVRLGPSASPSADLIPIRTIGRTSYPKEVKPNFQRTLDRILGG